MNTYDGRSKCTKMKSMVKRVEGGELIEWIDICRRLPIKKSFDIWMDVENPERHVTLLELLMPDSLRKPEAPISESKKYVAARSEWLSGEQVEQKS